jgi:hypothetical protein
VRNVLYVADSGNGRVRTVALDGSGAVDTLAGGGSAPIYNDTIWADGAGENATLAAPAGLAWLVDEGLLLLADAGGSRLRTINVTVRTTFSLNETAFPWHDTPGVCFVCFASQSGMVITVAGGMRGGSGLRDGVGVGALMNAPAGLAASAPGAGAVAFLADAGSHALRAVALAVAAKLTRALRRVALLALSLRRLG